MVSLHVGVAGASCRDELVSKSSINIYRPFRANRQAVPCVVHGAMAWSGGSFFLYPDCV
ncbi:MAG TPA: hypothetical protein DEF41_10220 [Desulfovibrio sp.]|uniref:Uncharacterized protein n=1 Tax=Nitratidesulfovibrio vulgaris (strain ATCC 29579 / DSM 644 / CCUG 34227 / NCIMB 8303 / VKM B-1760 / Hildenborough) TaxID=882 RepID=Q72D98_NITV2|nr:hypothetical protein DVU_1031 [Nitratidesulfovibrio vulgaris str. Hildenborough]HBW16480.1 hypothetical protein [Desulfovibrio sp.]